MNKERSRALFEKYRKFAPGGVYSNEQLRFANSGSETVMIELMIACAFTNKEKITKVERRYIMDGIRQLQRTSMMSY